MRLPLAGGAAGAERGLVLAVEFPGFLRVPLSPLSHGDTMAAVTRGIGGNWINHRAAAAGAGNLHGVSISRDFVSHKGQSVTPYNYLHKGLDR